MLENRLMMNRRKDTYKFDCVKWSHSIYIGLWSHQFIKHKHCVYFEIVYREPSACTMFKIRLSAFVSAPLNHLNKSVRSNGCYCTCFISIYMYVYEIWWPCNKDRLWTMTTSESNYLSTFRCNLYASIVDF